MDKKILFGIGYVSLIIIVWGSIGSLIDFGFLEYNIYNAGSLGQILTFSLTGMVFTIAAIYLHSKAISLIIK